MLTPSFRVLAITSIVLGALAACGGGGSSSGGDERQSFALEFAAVDGTTPVSCSGTLSGLGSGKTTARLQDLRFYISNVKLLTADDKEVALELDANDDWNHTDSGDAVTLIDLEDGTGKCATDGTKATNTTIKGSAPAGDYVGVKMTLGVPFALNHTDTATAPAPLDDQALGWGWQIGRKFSKIEVTEPASGDWSSPVFYVHQGSTGCEGNPANGEAVKCARANRMDFHFHAFDFAKQKIAIDLAGLFAGTDITKNTDETAPGCMSFPGDPECEGIFAAMKVDWDGSGTPIDEGHGQTLFKAVAK